MIAGASSLEEAYDLIASSLKGFCLEPLDNIYSEVSEEAWQEYQKHYREVYPSGILSFEDKRNFWLIQEDNTSLGIAYTHKNDDSLEFAIYSLESTHGKRLGIGKRALGIVKEIAHRENCERLRLVTTEECGVVDYYEQRGFDFDKESDSLIYLTQKL